MPAHRACPFPGFAKKRCVCLALHGRLRLLQGQPVCRPSERAVLLRIPQRGPKPGSRIYIYSAKRARFELANGLSRCRCLPLCRPTVPANASGAVATLVSAETGPRLRRVGVELPGDALSPSRAKRPDRCLGPASSVSRSSDSCVVLAPEIVSRSQISVRRVCAGF